MLNTNYVKRQCNSRISGAALQPSKKLGNGWGCQDNNEPTTMSKITSSTILSTNAAILLSSPMPKLKYLIIKKKLQCTQKNVGRANRWHEPNFANPVSGVTFHSEMAWSLKFASLYAFSSLCPNCLCGIEHPYTFFKPTSAPGVLECRKKNACQPDILDELAKLDMLT